MGGRTSINGTENKKYLKGGEKKSIPRRNHDKNNTLQYTHTHTHLQYCFSYSFFIQKKILYRFIIFFRRDIVVVLSLKAISLNQYSLEIHSFVKKKSNLKLRNWHLKLIFVYKYFLYNFFFKKCSKNNIKLIC